MVRESESSRPLRGRARRSLLCVFLAPGLWAQSEPHAEPPNLKPAAAIQPLRIPDGTPVQMRFARPVRAPVLTAGGEETLAHKGDRIRLVVAEDVRVQGVMVISKGAIGQASVHRVGVPGEIKDRHGVRVGAVTGLSLRLDWIEDVASSRVALRASAKGKAKPFTIEVLSQKGGMIARTASLRRDLFQSMTMTFLISGPHELTWVPAGTRITGFVDGAVELDPAEIKAALTLLPVPNVNALLTIFRTKGHSEDRPVVSCDEQTLVRIGPRQFTTVELTPGAHECRTESSKALEISLEAGEERFLEVRYKVLMGEWELQPVPISEGEDKTAGSEIILK